MSNCCIEFYKVGCFASCDCINTGLVLTEVGIHTVYYWFSNDSARFSFEYESDGTTELVFPASIANPNYPVYFDILQPSGDYFSVVETMYDNITNLASEVEYRCFWFETYQKIYREVRNACNPSFPLPCTDCNVDHDFALDPPNSFVQLPLGAEYPFLVNFVLEPCLTSILLQGIVTTLSGAPIANVVTYTPKVDYTAGFSGVVQLPITAIVGETYFVKITFIGYDLNNECYSPLHSFNLIIEVI